MRKLSLLLFTLLFAGNISAAKYSDKTYLSTRPQISNLALQQTTWHTNLYRRPDAKYNGTFQVTPFYQASTESTELGKYFGFDWGGTRGKENIISVRPEVQEDADPNGLVKVYNARYIIHNYDAVDTLAADYYMRPEQTIWGARFDYHQDLDKILDGLYFRISTPLVEVKNRIEITKVHEETSQAIPGLAGTNVTFLDYLSGNVENVVDANNLQDPLKYAKIDGTTHSSSGLADIDVRLGWKMLYKKWMRGGMSVGMQVPTGKTPKAEWLFEPVHGSGHHWGIGLNADLNLTLWRKNNRSIDLMFAADYKYLFQGIEKRTIDFFAAGSSPKASIKGGHYLLGGQENVAGAVFPLANVLTQDFKVTPGNQLDGIINLNVNYNNWIFDLGYNLFLKEDENLSLRNPWVNDKYAISGITYDTATNFSIIKATTTKGDAPGAGDGDNVAIQENYLDYDSIRTPAITTHKIFMGTGYQWNSFKYPTMLGFGASYEFANRNSAIENWSIWTKVGMSW
jgi:hypothetical protein